MPLYGPHNMRWLQGPEAADELAGLGNPVSSAEGIPEELFGRILDPEDFATATGEIHDQLHPLATIYDRLGSMLEDYTRPRLIQNMLMRMEGNSPGTMRNLYDAGLSALLSLAKKGQQVGESPETQSVLRRQIPAFIKGERANRESAD